MPGVGPMEIVVILIIALIVLGPKKLPEMARSAGRGMREFRSAMSMGPADEEEEEEEDEREERRRAKRRERIESGT
jgi:sec-independent protein translocase protein TatA